MELDILVIVLGALIIFTASFVKGFSSFGFALVAVPLMGLFFPLKIIAPITIVYAFIIDCMLNIKIGRHAQYKRMISMLIFGVISIPIGAYLLLVIEQDILKICVGIIIIICSWALFTGRKIQIKNVKAANIITGIMSGLFCGSITMSGPPVILFLKNQDVEKQIFRANLTFYFLILDIVAITSYFVGGLYSREVVNYLLIFLPFMIIGMFCGLFLGNRINSEQFNKFTLGLIFTAGVVAVMTSI